MNQSQSNSRSERCRVCGAAFFAEPLLRYENMPRVAQYLPDADALAQDCGVDLAVCQCSGCGLVQLRNAPVPYYREVIRAAGFSPEMREFRRKQFGDWVEKYALAGKRVVEIGCGRGEYLALMQQTRAQAFGLEYSGDSVQHCIKNGLRVWQGFVDRSDYRLPDAPFDAFFILSFLEHLPDPNSTLRGIAQNLTDDAVGLVEVPNFDLILRHNLFSEFMTDHLFYFTRATLATTLSLNGFDVIECQESWHDYILSAIVKKRLPLDLTHFRGQQARLKNKIGEYLQQFGNRRVAIWGAGHQAFAVIALAQLADRIKYVVDSAPFKQGKYTPATHLPIVAPDVLDADPVDAVIVMAASYSDEVARIVRQKYPRVRHIAIVREDGLEVVK